jgi:hypothetical protein
MEKILSSGSGYRIHILQYYTAEISAAQVATRLEVFLVDHCN